MWNNFFDWILKIIRKKKPSNNGYSVYGYSVYTGSTTITGQYPTAVGYYSSAGPTYSVAYGLPKKEKCHICGEEIDNLAGNPSKWGFPLYKRGTPITYCSGCVHKAVHKYEEDVIRERREKKLKRIIKDE